MAEYNYIIRSDSRNTTNYANANSFTLKLTGLPTQYKYFDTSVVGVYINDSSGNTLTKYAEIQCDNINIYSSYDTRTNTSKVLANNIGSFGGHPLSYRIENFNNRDVNFKVVDVSNSSLSVTNWVVVLKLTGVEE